MDVKEALEKRRAYRALGAFEVTDGLIGELAEAARLMPSCFNNQPWKFVFARSPEKLEALRASFSQNNDWAKKAPLVIAAFAGKEHDCVIKEREYYLFDLGMGVGALLLRAAELGLVAHPIAGFDPEAAKKALGIPDGNMLIALIIVGKKTGDLSALTPKQAEGEAERPARLAPENVFALDAYNDKLAAKAPH
jgi:nitroreductase